MISFSHHLEESLQISASKKAFNALSFKAKYAIQSWESSNWHDGDLVKHVRANDEVAQEIERAFAPIRSSIKGDTIKLYRGIWNKSVSSGWENRILESWTDDKKVAEHFAGRRQPGAPWTSAAFENIPTTADIKKAVAQFNRAGYTKFLGIHYILNKEHPQYYNMFDRRYEFITDGDVHKLERNLTSDVQDRLDHNSKILDRGKVIEQHIPKSQIIWLTNNLNSKEYIVRVR